VDTTLENVFVLFNVWVIRYESFILEHVKNFIIARIVFHPIMDISIGNIEIFWDCGRNRCHRCLDFSFYGEHLRHFPLA
jgi:hypothetical protein